MTISSIPFVTHLVILHESLLVLITELTGGTEVKEDDGKFGVSTASTDGIALFCRPCRTEVALARP